VRNISAEGMKALFAQETDEVFVFAVKVSHPYWVDSARLVSDNLNMMYNSELYIAYPFTVSLPAQQDGTLPSVELKIDNIDRQYVDEVRNVLDPPTAQVFLFRRSFDGSDTVEIGPMELKVVNLKYNVTALTLTLALDADYLNEPATKDRFLPSNAPGLFA
jgi:hypothetical protein